MRMLLVDGKEGNARVEVNSREDLANFISNYMVDGDNDAPLMVMNSLKLLEFIAEVIEAEKGEM